MRRNKRKGLAAVEAALILPIVVLITFCSIDISQYINLSQLINNASREGARIASHTSTSTVAEVESAVKEYFANSLPQVDSDSVHDTVQVAVVNAAGERVTGSLDQIESGEMFSVEVEFEFSDVRWLPGLDYWGGDNNTSRSTGRRE